MLKWNMEIVKSIILGWALGIIFTPIFSIAQMDKDSGGWRYLFDGKSTAQWRGFKKEGFPKSGWVVENGWLHCLGKDGGDIITVDQFDNFELELEWKIAPGANSGVKYFVTESRNSPIGHEYQIIDDDTNPDAKIADGKHLTGGFYDVLKPQNAKPLPPGQINRSKIVVSGNKVEHWLNGVKVLEYVCSSPELKNAIQDSKFKNTAGFGEKIKGHILLQDHHSEVWFRNIKIKTE
jgi:hypothetical protein